MEIEPQDKIKKHPINNKKINKSRIIRCVECNQMVKIKILPKTNQISSKCQIHDNTWDYSSFLQKCFVKCSYCFLPLYGNPNGNKYNCEKCHRLISNFDLNSNNDYPLYKETFIGFCETCNKNFDNYNYNEHNNQTCNSILFLVNILKPENEVYLNNTLTRKEAQLNNLINLVKNIPNNDIYKEKGNHLLLLLEEKKKELEIEKLIFNNYIDYKYNYFILQNALSLLEFEKANIFNEFIFPQNFQGINNGNILNQIRSYIQNGYRNVNLNHKEFNLINYKDCNNVYEIQKKNIKSIVALNESLIATGGWDRLLNIFNIYINKEIYSIETPSMIFNIKKYPLIEPKYFSINNHGILVCLYCELNILNIKEKNCKILGVELVHRIRGFGNYIWTSIIMDDKKIISACLDHRLSAHKILPNDSNTNKDIGYCLINSNMNKDEKGEKEEKEDITSLLQINENSFVSSSSMDLNDDPSIKFWKIENDNFILEKAIYDIYCCQYSNTICKINNNILGFALEYASLSGKEGGIALADINNKDIFAIIKIDSITSMASISNNRFFACSYDKNNKKRYIKEYMMNMEELKEKYKLEVHHEDDIINIELIKESDLLVISSDDGKITIFDNYSV